MKCLAVASQPKSHIISQFQLQTARPILYAVGVHDFLSFLGPLNLPREPKSLLLS